MIKAILNGLLTALTSVLNILLLPVNALLENLFPDMSNSISIFNSFVSQYVGGSLSYFFSILPPTFRGLLVVWFTFVISYYTIRFTYLGIIKLFKIIQKVKFW